MLSTVRAGKSAFPPFRPRCDLRWVRLSLAVATTAVAICAQGQPTLDALPPLDVIREGTSTYQIVVARGAVRTEAGAAALLREFLQASGVRMEVVTDKGGNAVSGEEIVVGETRRESLASFAFDRHTVGNEGFLIKAVGQRIFILGGSAAGTRTGVEFFLRKFCGDAGDHKAAARLATLSVPADYEHRQRQEYALSGFIVAGKDLGSFVIAHEAADLAAAEALRSLVYDSTGLWLRIAILPVTGPAIVFSDRKPDKPDFFEMDVSDGNIVLRTDVPQGFLRGNTCFFANEVCRMKGVYTMTEGFNYSQKLADVVCYREFGAWGDGVKDDIDAIAAAHDFANKHGLPVKADDNATYYIGGKDRTAVIQTDTDFGSARFIIDDTQVVARGANIFTVRSKLQPFKLEGVSSLKRNQRSLNITLPGTCIVSVTDSHIKRYIRYGANRNNGSPQTDICIVDKDGNVDMNAPIIWDFDQITDITAHPMDEKPLTITGGHFTTLANAAESNYTYYGRGLEIRRSNVVVDRLEHRITGEGDHGAPYGGFINIGSCANVTVKNTILTGHKTYGTIGSAGVPVSMGTYDISVNRALNISFLNCTQTNDIKDGKYWGIMGSNYCKNLLLDGCTWSRFDAHMGVANATIRNSTLGHAGINAIGSGTFTVENSTVYGSCFINLRSDYGSTWEGEFVVRNCVFIPAGGRKVTASLVGGSYSGQHDFGYPCYMPTRITIDKLRIDDANHPDNYQGPAIFANFNPNFTDDAYVEKYPYVRTEEVVVKDVTTASGKKLRLSDNLFMFKEVKVTAGNGE